MRISSRCGPEPRGAALEVARQPLVERRAGRRVGVVTERRGFEPELPRALGEGRRQELEHPAARLDELCRERHDLVRPRLERRGVGHPCRHTAQGGIALPERGRIGGRHVRARGERPREHAVEVRATGRWAALDHREPVRRERECVQTGAQLFRGREGGAVPPDPLRLACGDPDLRLDRDRAAAAGDPRESLLRATADDLAVLTRPEREPLRREVHRLEQVRLAGAVPARDEDEPWLELELEPRIRAHVAERNLLHDQVGSLLDAQPASRIGMIRYQNASPSALRSPGRSGLMSFSWTPSDVTDSSPSRRNSALNPISSGSPA